MNAMRVGKGLSTSQIHATRWPAFQRLTSNLIHVTQHKVGESLGFRSEYRTGHAMTTGVIALGIGDGMRRPVSESTITVLIKGQHAPVIGTSLEHTILDLTAIESPQVGDEVVLVGKMGNSAVTLEDWGKWFGCSPLEVVINFGGRVAPEYINQADVVWARFGAASLD
jgi:alanine racemase